MDGLPEHNMITRVFVRDFEIVEVLKQSAFFLQRATQPQGEISIGGPLRLNGLIHQAYLAVLLSDAHTIGILFM